MTVRQTKIVENLGNRKTLIFMSYQRTICSNYKKLKQIFSPLL